MGRGRFNGSGLNRGGGVGSNADLMETSTADSCRWSWAS